MRRHKETAKMEEELPKNKVTAMTALRINIAEAYRRQFQIKPAIVTINNAFPLKYIAPNSNF